MKLLHAGSGFGGGLYSILSKPSITASRKSLDKSQFLKSQFKYDNGSL
ncbi:MAG TPA: hypothetical protein VJ873_10130 [bacterium]|nr:hypothetical protein [bacterium]